jgi:hypothetical protein
MELIEAAKNIDVEKVKVRRPLEAVCCTENGPSRAVCLGLGQWTIDAVVARPIRPCCAESSPYVRRPSGTFDDACRRSFVPVTTSRSVTRTLPCRLAESQNFSPPPSPAIAVSATFLSLARLMDARAGCEMASTPSPPGVLFPSTVTKNENAADPRGLRAGLCFGYRLGNGVPPWGPFAHPGPAVHSFANTALHYAAECGNRRIVRLLVASGADVNAQDDEWCAVSACGDRPECAGRVPAAVCRAGGRRCTVPCTKAKPTSSPSSCCAAPTGPSRTSRGDAALRRTAEPKPHSCARAGSRRSNGRKPLGSSRSTRQERGRCTPPAASQPRRPSCLAPHPSPRCLCRRCLPSALADPAGREATTHVELAL